MTILDGLRVLVVEDELLVAMVVEEALRHTGCVVLGPLPRVAKAMEVAREAPIDVAILDVNLAGERVYPIADALIARDLPFIFMTGYGRDELPAQYKGRPTIAKPFKIDRLLSVLIATVNG